MKNLLDSRSRITTEKAKGNLIPVKRPLKAMHNLMEVAVLDFVKWVHSERFPATSNHLKARALRAASKLKITGFRASIGFLQNLIRRSAIQLLFKLHGKGGLDLPTDTKARMRETRYIGSYYELANIYCMDDSGLFNRNGPHQSYLKLQKHKRFVSIVMCVNADGSDVFPVSYIDTETKPKCLTDPRFVPKRQ